MVAVFVNMAAVLIGSLTGIAFRKSFKQAYADGMISALALITILIGVSSGIQTQKLLCVILCLVLGTALGTLLRIDDRLNAAGELVKTKLLRGRTAGSRFTEGFVSACLLFCIGSMTIIGSFEAGINRNYNIIFAKSAMDFVSSIMFGAAMGIGVTFSVVFIFLFQGGLTLLANVLSPFLSGAIVTEMSAIGGTILIGMGLNLLELSPRKIKVANMLPAIFLPIAYFPLYELINQVLP